MENDKIVWDAPEYIFRKKNREWFMVLGIIGTALLVVAIVTGNFLFGIIIVLAVFTSVMFAQRPPNVISYEINRSGLTIDRTFYPYSFLQSFWVDNTEPHWQKLLVTSKKLFMPMLIVSLGDQDADEVRNFLGNYLPEKEQYEPLSHRIVEYLGF